MRSFILVDIKFKIIQRIGVLSETGSGWSKQLNLISWNDQEAKYDLRQWAPDGENMGKGVTLSKKELLALRELLNRLEL